MTNNLSVCDKLILPNSSSSTSTFKLSGQQLSLYSNPDFLVEELAYNVYSWQGGLRPVRSRIEAMSSDLSLLEIAILHILRRNRSQLTAATESFLGYVSEVEVLQVCVSNSRRLLKILEHGSVSSVFQVIQCVRRRSRLLLLLQIVEEVVEMKQCVADGLHSSKFRSVADLKCVNELNKEYRRSYIEFLIESAFVDAVWDVRDIEYWDVSVARESFDRCLCRLGSWEIVTDAHCRYSLLVFQVINRLSPFGEEMFKATYLSMVKGCVSGGLSPRQCIVAISSLDHFYDPESEEIGDMHAKTFSRISSDSLCHAIAEWQRNAHLPNYQTVNKNLIQDVSNFESVIAGGTNSTTLREFTNVYIPNVLIEQVWFFVAVHVVRDSGATEHLLEIVSHLRTISKITHPGWNKLFEFLEMVHHPDFVFQWCLDNVNKGVPIRVLEALIVVTGQDPLTSSFQITSLKKLLTRSI